MGMIGPVLGVVIAFGRWKRAPLYEVAVPGMRLVGRRLVKRDQWTRRSLLATGSNGCDRFETRSWSAHTRRPRSET
jgi:hypothetical protein